MGKESTLTVTETRKKLFELIEKVQAPGTFYVLTERGRPKAVLLSYEEYESITETLDILQEEPNIMQQIEEAHNEFDNGEYYILEDRNGEVVYKKFSRDLLKERNKAAKKTTRKRSS